MKKNKLNIACITSSRAEYGQLKLLLKEIISSDELNLKLIVTGTHLSKRHGYTIREIEEDKFKIDYKLDMELVLDSNKATCKSLAKLTEKLSIIFDKLKPDLVLLLGDRFELLGVASAATIFRIPIAHLHGGEITEGCFDESIRHAISKLSHLHFVANETYRNRLIQLGEDPKNVFNVGGLGVDAIKNIKLLDKKQLEDQLKIKFLKKNLLITYHPLTLSSSNKSIEEFTELIKSLQDLKDTFQIFTMPNADQGNEKISRIIKEYVEKNINSVYFISLGQLKYLSCLAYVDAVVGNTSSGISEAPSFKIATLNIGDRQKGRLMSESIINCGTSSKEISKSINKIYDPLFKEKLANSINPYGSGGASKKIVKIIPKFYSENLIKKKFYDINFL